MKRVILRSTSLLVLGLFSGCATPSGADEKAMMNVGFSVWNPTLVAVNDPAVRSVEEPHNNFVSYSVSVGPASPDYGRTLYRQFTRDIPPQFAGNAQLISLPEEVDVSWEKRLPNSNVRTGDTQGPYRVKVRARIPPEVLALAAKDNNYRLHISFSVGELPILLNWKLLQYKESMMGFSQTLRETHRGGDSLFWVEQGADNKENPINVFR